MDSQSPESRLGNSCMIENCMMGDEPLHLKNTLTLHVPVRNFLDFRENDC